MDQVRFGIDHSLWRDGFGGWGFEVELQPIIGLTPQGVQVRVWYDARGDFLDRWVDRHGHAVTLVRWRPDSQASLLTRRRSA